MAEETLGFAKLLLSADSSELKKGIEEAKAHARSMGKTMAEVADEVGGKGRRILMAQQDIDRAVINATGTATQRQLAAVDERYGKLLEKARRHGLATAELERAASAEKSRIWEAEAARAKATLDARAAAEKKTAGAVTEGAGATTKATHALGGFKELMKVAGGEARGMAGALGHLANSGFGAAITAVAVATKLLGDYINKLSEGRRANFALLQGIQADRRGVKELAAEVAALEAGRTDTEVDKKQREVADLMLQLENLDRQIEAESKLHGPEFLGGGKAKEFEDQKTQVGNRLDTAKRELDLLAKKADLEGKRDFEREIGALSRRNQMESESVRLSEDQAKVKRGIFEIEEKYRALLEDVTSEERKQAFLTQKALEIETLKTKSAQEASARQAKRDKEDLARRIKANDERIENFRDVEAAIGDMEIARLKRVSEAEGATRDDRQALLDAEKDKELRALGDRYGQLGLKAAGNEEQMKRLTEETFAERALIEKKYADASAALLVESGSKATEYASVAGSAFEEVAAKVKGCTLSLRDMNDAQLETLSMLRKADQGVSVNDGRGFSQGFTGYTTAEALIAATRPFAGAFINPGASPIGTYGPGVNPAAPTSMQTVKITLDHRVSGRGGRFDEDVLAAAEEDIRRGGSLSKVLEDYFNVQRTPR